MLVICYHFDCLFVLLWWGYLMLDSMQFKYGYHSEYIMFVFGLKSVLIHGGSLFSGGRSM